MRYILDSAADKDDDANWTVIADAWTSGALRATVSGLTNGTDYRFQVRAGNAGGKADWPAVADAVLATPIADSADLTGITVNGTAVPDFDADHTTYRAGVVHTASQPGVIGMPVAGNATIACSVDADGNAGNGCQVAVANGESESVTLTVTAGSLTKTYTVTVARGRAGSRVWKAEDDIYGFARFAPSANRFSRGMWSDGTTLWAANNNNSSAGSRLWAFELATGARDADNDIDRRGCDADQPEASSVLLASTARSGWPTRMQQRLRAYRRNSSNVWEPHDASGFSTSAVSNIQGIWTDGDVMWAAHDGPSANTRDGFIFAFSLADGARLNSEDFNTLAGAGNDDPRGIWSDGETMWVYDSTDHKLYAYDMVTKARVSGKDFSHGPAHRGGPGGATAGDSGPTARPCGSSTPTRTSTPTACPSRSTPRFAR